MGRGRAPCCEKIGLNKGSWTPEEDMRLVSYIHKYGHSSWRALPKQAGLLRCGKSCRLRWINYLRPDVKRGNFSKEEEDDIIRLHASLGNKWSKIASLLPGRTDNEIKNVWNTHLKKRLQKPKDGEAEEKRKCSEEPLPSSPSSLLSVITAPASCSEQVESRTESEGTDANLVTNKVASEADVEESIDKIEIPIEPNMGLWELLDDDDDHYFPKPSNCLSSCSSSSNMVTLKDPMEEIWSMIEDEIGVGTDACNDQNRAAPDDESSESTWLAYLEKELELWDNNDVNNQESTAKVEGGDPLTSYFQRSPSPSVVPPLDDLLY